MRDDGSDRRGGTGDDLVALLHPLGEGLRLVVVQTAELVLDVITQLFAVVEQVLALDVQRLRQLIDPHFLLSQATLPRG
jgi:hypothetical protein